MGADPLVSIVVPVLNGERHINACIDSVLSQDYRHLDIVIADNDSDDRTRSIVAAYSDSRIRTLEPVQTRLSLHDNWGRAMREARGEFVKLVCHDDLLLSDCVSVQLAMLQQHRDAHLVASKRRIIDDEGRVLMNSRGLGPFTNNNQNPAAAGVIAHACTRAGTNLLGEPAGVLIRRSSLPELLFDPQWHYPVDIDFYLRCLAGGAGVFEGGVRSCFRVSPNQMSADLANRQAKEMRSFLKSMPARYPNDVRGGDVRIGEVRAQMLSWGRRAMYRRLVARSSVK